MSEQQTSSVPSDGPAPRAGTVEAVADPGQVLVRLAGEVDADLGAELDAAVAVVVAAGPDVVARLDAGAVDFMDSTGLRFLARLHQVAGGPLRLVAASPAVRTLVDLMGMQDLLVDEAAGA